LIGGRGKNAVVGWVALGWLVRSGATAARIVNVTVVGAEWNWTASGTLPAGWGAKKEGRVGQVQSFVKDCPPGRYCPRGSSAPLACAAGTYSSQRGRAVPCDVKCFQNYYCPDAGRLLQCPANTYSDRGAVSRLGCKCNAGFQCTYKKVTNVNVGLRVPYQVMTGPEGEELKRALLQVVAEVAGVSVGSVRIDKILPGRLQGGARRLLAEGKRDASVLLSLSVEGGGESLDGLQERLGRRREFRQAVNRVHWRRVETLQVLPAPKAWEFWVWRAK
jgi:hypothetical protein